MSVPSSPPQGDSASTAAAAATAADVQATKPQKVSAPADIHPTDADSTNTHSAGTPEYDPSQEDMAHEYVDYYVTNPVDRPTTGPLPDAPDHAATDDKGSALSPTGETDEPDPTDGPDDNRPDAGADSTPPLPPVPPAPPSPPDSPDDAALMPSPNGAPAVPTGVPTGTPADSKTPAAPPEAKAMSLMDHLGELRTRLVRCAIIVALAFAATYSVADLIFAELMRPLLAALPPNSKLIFTALPEAFFVYLQVGFVAAIFLASPYIFYQIWSFIAPGLYEEEKKFAVPMALCSAFFFILGAAFCFLVVFPFSFSFFVGFATEDIVPMPSLSEYLSFALKMLIAFGLIFEMPLFTFFLARMGLVTAAMMRKVRRYAILVIFIVAAILTPPDVMSQMLMAIPMLLLYEFSIFIALAFGKKPKTDSDTTENSDSTSGKATAQAAPANSAGDAATDTQSPAPSAP